MVFRRFIRLMLIPVLGLLSISSSLANADALSNVPSCKPLEVSESTWIFFDFKSSPTGIPVNYRLTRVSANAFKSEVPILFRPAANIDEEQVKKFRERVKTCLNETSRYLINSDGESLQIELAEDLSKFKTWIGITIVEHSERENSLTLALDTPCSAIVHEIFHHHGLVDEYIEKILTNPDRSPMFNCRAPGSPNSVMSDPTKALEQLRMKHFDVVQLRICSDSNSCQVFSSTVPVGHKIDEDSLKKYGATIVGRITTFRNEILGRNQFESIVRPGCINSLAYYSCAANTYRNEPNCLNASPICSDPKLWTGVDTY